MLYGLVMKGFYKTFLCSIYPPYYSVKQFSIVNKFVMSLFLQKSKILRWLPTPTSGTLSILAGLLSSACLGTWLFSSSFYVKQIHFEGNDRISDRALHHLSDIHVKTHVFSIFRPENIEKIESKIEEELTRSILNKAAVLEKEDKNKKKK